MNWQFRDLDFALASRISGAIMLALGITPTSESFDLKLVNGGCHARVETPPG